MELCESHVLCTMWQCKDNCASVLLSFWWVLLSSSLRWGSAASHPWMVVLYPSPFGLSPHLFNVFCRTGIDHIFLFMLWEETTTPRKRRSKAAPPCENAAPPQRRREKSSTTQQKEMGKHSTTWKNRWDIHAHRPCPAPPPRRRRSGEHHTVGRGRSSPPPPPRPNSSLDGNPAHPETTKFSLRKLHVFGNASRSQKNLKVGSRSLFQNGIYHQTTLKKIHFDFLQLNVVLICVYLI